ncbi:hypothetical protein VKT23_007271 [Stygiomarasmius scandens]|uniref:Uncharacterized protein n=1 Tax=Marasmiellus scandens TaxID=2682957 RepID=A0ABR1JM24_9AGAR
MSLRLKWLLSEPFGPYPEHKILVENLTPNDKSRLILHQTFMMMGQESTGLDESEFVEAAPEQLPDVRFFGILNVERLGWLSKQGRDWLEKDLKERDQKENCIKKSGLTLERLYGMRPGEGSIIRVWICCEKTSSAKYLTDNRRPESLLLSSKWTSEDEKRMYYNEFKIQSFDVETYARSRKFFGRWRLHTLVRMIISERHPPPVEERTVDWLVKEILRYHQEVARKHRFVFDAESDSDVDETGKTTRRRYLRHVPRAEVLRLLAKHAEWFLAQQVATGNKSHHLVNLPDLYKFCCKVKKDGRVNLERFGVQNWEKKVDNYCINPKKKIVTRTRSPMPDNGPVEFEYDSDFSVDSSEADSDSDADTVDMELSKKVPSWCLDPPQLSQFQWHCPGPKCDYSFDLRRPVPQLPHDDQIFLEQTPWCLSDSRIIDIVVRVTSEHYRKHLREEGVDFVWRNGKARLISCSEEAPMEGVEENVPIKDEPDFW